MPVLENLIRKSLTLSEHLLFDSKVLTLQMLIEHFRPPNDLKAHLMVYSTAANVRSAAVQAAFNTRN